MATLLTPNGMTRVTDKDGHPYTIFDGRILNVPESQVAVLLEAGAIRGTDPIETPTGPLTYMAPAVDADGLDRKFNELLLGLAIKNLWNGHNRPASTSEQVTKFNLMLTGLAIKDIAPATTDDIMTKFNLLLAELQARGLMSSTPGGAEWSDLSNGNVV